MTRRGRTYALAAGALLVSVLTPAPPAQALPVFTEAAMLSYSHGEDTSQHSCTVEEDSSPVQANVPVVENGAATSLSTSSSGTITNPNDPSDVISFGIASTTMGRVTSAGGNPGVIELATDGRVQADTSTPTSACRAVAFSSALLNLSFTVAQAGFMTFAIEADPSSYAGLYIVDTGDSAFIDQAGFGVGVSGVIRVHLPPGTYLARLHADPYLRRTSTAVPSTPVSVSVRGSFALAGSQSATPAGKGKRFLSFAGARSCATGSVDATVTDKRKRVKQIRKVRLFVNGALVRSLTTPRKGQQVRLPVSNTTDAQVRAEVVLRPAKPGHKPRVKEVTTGYAPCSAG